MKRLSGVMRVYLTRPLCWLLLAIIATYLTTGLSLFSEEYQSYNPVTLSKKLSKIFVVYSQDSLNTALEKQNGQAVSVSYGQLARDLKYKDFKTDAAGVRSKVIISPEETAERLDQLEFPSRTQWLATGALEVQQATIDRISNVTSLEHVELLVAKSGDVALDFTPFAKLVNLKSLNLGQITKIDSLMSLKTLPKLETFTIGNHQLVTGKNMREVAAIKSLKKLFLPDVSHNPVAMTALGELNASSLERICVAIPPSQTAKLQSISSAVVDVQVRPSLYSLMRLWGCGGVLWLILMMGFLGLHFLAMFAVPAAELTPGYRVTQGRVAWAVMVGLILLGAGVMWSCKINLGLSIALSASALLISVSGQIPVQTMTKPTSGLGRFYGLLFLAASAGIIGWAVQDPLAADYLLANPRGWVVVLLSLMAIFLAANLYVKLNSMCRDRVAAGNEPIVSFFDMQEVGLKLQSERLGDQVEPFDRMTKGMAGIGLVLLLSVLVLNFAPAFWFTPMIEGVLQNYLPMFAFGAVWMVLLKWWRRAPFLATMITRPPCRKSQIKQVFIDIAADFARAVPLLLAAVFVMSSRVADRFGSAAEAGVATFLLAAGIVGLFYALTLALITVRSVRSIIVSSIVLILTVSVGSGLISFIVIEGGLETLELGMFIALSTLSVVMLVMAVAATMLMWRRYHRIEWGSFLS